MNAPPAIHEDVVRRWLNLLRQPNRLDSADMRALLAAHGRLPADPTPLDVGRAAARFLADMIDRLAAPPDAPPSERLPQAVLRTCFVEGAKLPQAAAALGLSERQLTRERRRAISLLTGQLSLGPVRSRFVPEEIPTIVDFVARPDVLSNVYGSLSEARSARIHGPPGIGKTTIAAEIAADESRTGAVWWYRFRRGVNDTLSAVMFELGHWLASHGLRDLAEYVAPNPAEFDATVAARIAIRSLGETSVLAVLDDYHTVDDDPPVTGFFDEALVRTPALRLITLSRHRPKKADERDAIEVPAFTLEQTERLLLQARVRWSRATTARIHSWTGGNPHLVKLSASWLERATAQEIARGVESLLDQEEVQEFLLGNIAELLDSDDRGILEAASIFRGRFSDDALAYVAQQTRAAVRDASRRLVRSYVATRNRHGVSAFFHAAVRDYVYERLHPDARAALHLRAAAWFHRLGDDEETAYHRERGGLETA